MLDLLIKEFEIRNSNLLTFESLLSERQLPSYFYCSPRPFKVFSLKNL